MRVNRVEGIALGGGLSRHLGAGLAAETRVRFGFADHELKGTARFGWEHATGVAISVSGGNDFRLAGDAPETSGVRNSIAAQEFGSDFTDAFRTRGVTLTLDIGTHSPQRWRVSLERAREDPLEVHARPVSGRYAAAFPAVSLTGTTLALSMFAADRAGPWGSRVRAQSTVALTRARLNDPGAFSRAADFARVNAAVGFERPFGASRLVFSAIAAGAVGPRVPQQALALFGGPVTGPGYDFHQFAARSGLSTRVEWRQVVVRAPVSLGRYGHVSTPITLAPFAQGIWVHGRAGYQPNAEGFFPALGVGLLTAFDVLRFDVARGLREGRWTFGVDVSPEFWRVF